MTDLEGVIEECRLMAVARYIFSQDMSDNKKPQSGFVPIYFRIAGWGMLAIGIACLALYGFDFFTKTFSLPQTVFLFGIFMILAGFYLLFVVPREK